MECTPFHSAAFIQSLFHHSATEAGRSGPQLTNFVTVVSAFALYGWLLRRRNRPKLPAWTSRLGPSRRLAACTRIRSTIGKPSLGAGSTRCCSSAVRFPAFFSLLVSLRCVLALRLRPNSTVYRNNTLIMPRVFRRPAVRSRLKGSGRIHRRRGWLAGEYGRAAAAAAAAAGAGAVIAHFVCTPSSVRRVCSVRRVRRIDISSKQLLTHRLKRCRRDH
jgi:hypothetical protein